MELEKTFLLQVEGNPELDTQLDKWNEGQFSVPRAPLLDFFKWSWWRSSQGASKMIVKRVDEVNSTPF